MIRETAVAVSLSCLSPCVCVVRVRASTRACLLACLLSLIAPCAPYLVPFHSFAAPGPRCGTPRQPRLCRTPVAHAGRLRKCLFLSHFILKIERFPRQARVKRRENSQRHPCSLLARDCRHPQNHHRLQAQREPHWCEKNGLCFVRLHTENNRFAKTARDKYRKCEQKTLYFLLQGPSAGCSARRRWQG